MKSPAQHEQVLTGAPGFWSPTLSLLDALRQLFCLIPILRQQVSTWACPAACMFCTGEQQAEHWQVRSDAWRSFLSSGRWQTDRQTEAPHWLAVCQAMLKGWGQYSLQHGMSALSGIAQVQDIHRQVIVWDLLCQC